MTKSVPGDLPWRRHSTIRGYHRKRLMLPLLPSKYLLDWISDLRVQIGSLRKGSPWGVGIPSCESLYRSEPAPWIGPGSSAGGPELEFYVQTCEIHSVIWLPHCTLAAISSWEQTADSCYIWILKMWFVQTRIKKQQHTPQIDPGFTESWFEQIIVSHILTLGNSGLFQAPNRIFITHFGMVSNLLGAIMNTLIMKRRQGIGFLK